jgi:hypothetical protein
MSKRFVTCMVVSPKLLLLRGKPGEVIRIETTDENHIFFDFRVTRVNDHPIGWAHKLELSGCVNYAGLKGVQAKIWFKHDWRVILGVDQRHLAMLDKI